MTDIAAARASIASQSNPFVRAAAQHALSEFVVFGSQAGVDGLTNLLGKSAAVSDATALFYSGVDAAGRPVRVQVPDISGEPGSRYYTLMDTEAFAHSQNLKSAALSELRFNGTVTAASDFGPIETRINN